MNILFLCKFFYPAIGGVEKHVEAVGEELVKLGHRVTVITLKHDPRLKKTVVYRGIKIIRIPYCESKWGIWRSLWLKRELVKKNDLVHCHDVFFWYLPFRFIYFRKPIFTTFHGWEGKFPIPKRYVLARKIWEKLSWGNICVGEYLTKWYGTKADFVTYGGITFSCGDRHRKMLSKDLKKGIFIGRLTEDLGLAEYLKVLQTLKQKGWQITFVGDGPYRPQAEKLGRVVGFVKNLKPYLIRPALIFSASYLTIWEALSYGRPVFALYQNPLKQDYLTHFPAAANIHISGSAEALLAQLEKRRPACQKLPLWREVTSIYLKLWHKKTALFT